MTQPPNPNVPNGQPFDPNQIPTDPQQAAAWAQQQQAAAWQQQQAAWQQQAAQEAQEQAHQEYLEQQAAEAKKSGGLGLRGIISIIVGVVVVGAGAWGLYQKFQTDQALQEGNCIVIEGESNDKVTPKKVDCSKDDFSWKVTAVVADENSCPEDSYTGITVTSEGRRGASRTDKVACLVPFFKADKCYSKDASDVNEFKVGTCSTGELKIIKVIEDPAASCEVPEQTVNFPSAKLTYCGEEVA